MCDPIYSIQTQITSTDLEGRKPQALIIHAFQVEFPSPTKQVHYRWKLAEIGMLHFQGEKYIEQFVSL